MTTPTSNFAWAKPVVGADSDTWGTELNALADAIDTALGSGATGAALNPLSVKLGTGNTLSTYLEGTWTVTDTSGAALALTVTNAAYRKIGKLVYLEMDITYPATGSGATANLSTLPFTPSVDAFGFIVANNTPGYAAMITTTTAFGILSAAGVQQTNANLSGVRLRLSCCYPTAA